MTNRIATSALALFFLVGCSSSGGGGKGEGSKTIESFKDVGKQLTTASAQVDKTLAAMDQMAAGGDLSKSYANYVKQVDALEGQAKAAKKRGDSMRTDVKKYVSKWQAEMDEIDDATITASMQSRRAAVKANFDKVKEAGQKARDAYTPFMERLRRIQKAIQIDMTPAAVTSMKPAMDEAHKDGENLKAALAAMQSELDSIRNGMSAAPSPTPSPSPSKQ